MCVPLCVKSEDTFGVIPQVLPFLLFETRSPMALEVARKLSWTLPRKLAWVVRKHQGFSCVCLLTDSFGKGDQVHVLARQALH